MILSSNPGKRRRYLAISAGSEAAVTVAGDGQLQRPFRTSKPSSRCYHCDGCGYAGFGFLLQVHVHLGVEHPLGQRLLPAPRSTRPTPAPSSDHARITADPAGPSKIPLCSSSPYSSPRPVGQCMAQHTKNQTVPKGASSGIWRSHGGTARERRLQGLRHQRSPEEIVERAMAAASKAQSFCARGFRATEAAHRRSSRRDSAVAVRRAQRPGK